jgi:hypothetical protein
MEVPLLEIPLPFPQMVIDNECKAFCEMTDTRHFKYLEKILSLGCLSLQKL